MSILKYDNIDISKVNYLKPEKIGPSYFASISYGDNLKPFLIQTPKLKCLTSIEDMKDKKNKYLEVEIPKGKFDMYDLFLSLDDQNIKTKLSVKCVSGSTHGPTPHPFKDQSWLFR